MLMPKESVCGESKIMVRRASVLLLILVGAVVGLPQPVRLPEFQNFSPPEEVNAALQDNTQKVPRSINNHADVDNTEDTIREVERLIKANPELPRLTRGEILDILDNITKHDQNNLLRSFGKKFSDRDPKALMVVKAYTPLGSDGETNMEAFYTKPPITSIIEEEGQQTLTEIPQEFQTKTTTQHTPHFRRKTTKPSDVKKPSSNQSQRKPSRGSVQFKTTINDETNTISSISRRVTTTEKPSSTTEQVIYSSTRREVTKRRRRPIVTSSTTTPMPVTTYRPRRRQTPPKELQYQNHKYPAQPTRRPLYSSEGIKVINPPIMTTNPAQINSDLEDLLPLEMVNGQRFVPLPAGILSQQNLLDQSSLNLEIPDDLKKLVADINLGAAQQQISKSTTRRVRFTTSSSTTTTTEAPNAFAVADSLSPEMQELLKNFGLLPDPNEVFPKTDSSQFNPEKAEIDPKSYTGFKPLPQDNDGRREMADLLAQYGLLNNSSRTSKVLKRKQISLDMVPDNLKPVLLDMGLTDDRTRTGRKIRQQPLIKTSDKDSAAQSLSQHVFSPEGKPVSEENMKKLQRLLEIMKKLEGLNGTVTEENVDQEDRAELKELILSLKQTQGNKEIATLNEQKAPNPNEFELGSSRNEVKRQEEEEEIVTVTAESLPDDTVTPSMKDLEESFGGVSDTVTEALPEPTTPKRSGFYYLLDWNTFFEIDDQKGKRVNLRFQPKVGDPKRFFSVNIP